jgi:uncharacterized protein CbrC (UPF0167 family)
MNPEATAQMAESSQWIGGDWFVTYTGRKVSPFNLKPEDVALEDVAHALANTCRYCGHTSSFYSVAQHSVLVSKLVDPAFAMDGLLHDAPEAYCHDIIRPIKRRLAGYEELERNVWLAVCERFGIGHSSSRLKAVKRADLVALATERRDLIPGYSALVSKSPGDWALVDGPERIEPDPRPIKYMGPRRAEAAFLSRFRALEGRRSP